MGRRIAYTDAELALHRAGLAKTFGWTAVAGGVLVAVSYSYDEAESPRIPPASAWRTAGAACSFALIAFAAWADLIFMPPGYDPRRKGAPIIDVTKYTVMTTPLGLQCFFVRPRARPATCAHGRQRM